MVCVIDKAVPTLSVGVGVQLNLNWITLEDFQKHLNGENEDLTPLALTPSKFYTHIHTCAPFFYTTHRTVVDKHVHSLSTSFYCVPFIFTAELRDAIKNGNYVAVKRALRSKDDYNLDQEVRHVYSHPVFQKFEFFLCDSSSKQYTH